MRSSNPSQVPQRTLGSTGESVSCIALGGSHIGSDKVSDLEAIRLIQQAVDSGITFLDNSWDYHNGRSESLMGRALADGYRNRAFLMTKFDGRDKASAARQIDESLRRLRVDHVDLLQFHEVIRFDDIDRFFAPGGAVEALREAQESGKTRYVGFTGHKDPHLHLYMLEVADREGFRFDTVQMPLNVLDAHYRSFEQMVLPELNRRGIAPIGMKSLAGGVIVKQGIAPAEDCLRYSLSLPIAALVTGIDGQDKLEQALRAALQPVLPAAERDRLLQSTRHAATRGQFELFKTTSVFDSTAKNPDYLGGTTEYEQALAPAS